MHKKINTSVVIEIILKNIGRKIREVENIRITSMLHETIEPSHRSPIIKEIILHWKLENNSYIYGAL